MVIRDTINFVTKPFVKILNIPANSAPVAKDVNFIHLVSVVGKDHAPKPQSGNNMRTIKGGSRQIRKASHWFPIKVGSNGIARIINQDQIMLVGYFSQFSPIRHSPD